MHRGRTFAAIAVVACLCLASPLLVAQTSQWTAAGPLVTARSGHTVTLLSDGRALIAGGENSGGLVAAAEIYDPATGTSTSTGNMVAPRKHAAAVLLQDGRVLIVGGEDSTGALASAEVFDPTNGTFTAVGSMAQARNYTAAVLQSDGTVLVIGGENSSGPLATIEKFDPTANTFSTLSYVLGTARAEHTATLLNDGRILVAGGRSGATALASTEYIEPSAQTTTPGPTLANARYAHSATLMLYGNVALVGGWDGTNIYTNAEIVEANGTVAVAGNQLSVGRYGHVALLLPDNQAVMILGGDSASGPVSNVDILDPTTLQFSTTGSMLTPRDQFAAVARNGVACAIAGNDSGAISADDSYGFATIKTDKADYPPNSTVNFTGTGWTPGETVTIHIHETDGDPDTILTSVADASGNIQNSTLSTQSHDGGTFFDVVASGATSQRVAYETFTDAQLITSISPATSAPNQSITFQIYGQNFTAGTISSVTVGGISVPYTVVSGTEIDATVGAPITTTAGTYPVVVNESIGAYNACCFSAATGCVACTQTAVTSASSAVTIQATDTTTTAVTSSKATTVFGESVTFTATITDSTANNHPSCGTPTPCVTFNDSGNLGAGFASCSSLTAVNPNKGTCTTATAALAPGTHLITANYGGNTASTPNFGSSNSPNFTQTVNKANTTTTITTTNNNTVFSDGTLTFTTSVSVNAPGSGTPTGTVTVVNTSSGGTVIGTCTLSSGTCSVTNCSTACVNVGNNSTITATYSGDTDFNTSNGTVTQTITQASDTMAVTTSGSPAVFGSSVAFTATMTPTAPAILPVGGTVKFSDSGNLGANFATCTTTTGSCTVSTSGLDVATSPHTITAAFQATTEYKASSNTVPQSVTQATSTVTVSSSANPSVFGQGVVITATVAPTGATGNVAFTIDGTPNAATCTLSTAAGVTSCSLASNTGLSVASHSYVANYAGDTNVAASSSSTFTQTVNKANSTTAVNSTPASPTFGQGVTFTATVTATAPGSGTATGTVTFDDSGNLGAGFATCTLAAGTCSTGTFTMLATGPHTITANYSGDTNFNGNPPGTGTVALTVAKANSTTTITSGLNPSTFGESVTYTVIVAPVAPASSSPTGSVTVKDSTSATLGTCTLTAGTCAVTSGAAAQGTPDTITATYNGDTDFNTSSGTVAQTVAGAATTTTVTGAPNPSVFGQTVTFTATIAVLAPGSGTPTGTVTWNDSGGATITTCTLSGGACSSSTSALSTTGSPHTITATYVPANSNFVTSTGTTSQTVNQASTTTTALSSANPSSFGQGVVISASVAAVAPASGTPTGTVAFTIDGAPSTNTAGVDLCVLVSGSCSLNSNSGLAAGNHTYVATYSGDPSFLSSASGTLTQAVNPDPTTTTISAPAVTFNSNATITVTVAGAGGPPTGTLSLSIDGGAATTKTLSGGVATFTIVSPRGGSHSLVATYPTQANWLGSTGNATLTVNTRAVTPTLSPVSTKQYSDPATFQEIILNGNLSGFKAATSATFKVGTQVMGTANFVASGNNLVATLVKPLLETVAGQMAPGAHTVTGIINGIDATDYTVAASTSQTLTITQEDARAIYTGPVTLTVPCTVSAGQTTTCGTTANANPFTLSATVQGVDLPVADTGGAGVINKAIVAFHLGSACYLAPVVGTGSSGIASVNVSNFAVANPGSAPQFTLTITIGKNCSNVPSGYYTNGSTPTSAVTVTTTPIATPGLVRATGYLNMFASTGTNPARAGTRMNFGFILTAPSNLSQRRSGSFNVVYVATNGRVYRLQATSAQPFLAEQLLPGGKTAVLEYPGNVYDITTPTPKFVTNCFILVYATVKTGVPPTLEVQALTSGGTFFQSNSRQQYIGVNPFTHVAEGSGSLSIQ